MGKKIKKDKKKQQVCQSGKEDEQWPDLDLKNWTVILIIGTKDTGKSTLAQYLLKNTKDVCLLDCDIGKGSSYPGCVCLKWGQQQQSKRCFYVGQCSPGNNVQKYIKCIAALIAQYRQQYFNKKLVINTVGYLSGLGQLVCMAIHSISQPDLVVQLISPGSKTRSTTLLQSFQTGAYTKRNYLDHFNSCSSKIIRFLNQKAQPKPKLGRFQTLIGINSLTILINMLHSKMASAVVIGKLYLQAQDWKQLSQIAQADHKVVYLGYGDQHQFQVTGIGYGFNGKIWCLQGQGLSYNAAVISHRLGFSRQFYNTTEDQIIQLQLEYGRLNYVSVWIKALGSKSLRNIQAKNQEIS